MHYWLKALAFAAIVCTSLHPAAAQYSDSTGTAMPATDTIRRAVNWCTPAPSNAFPVRSFIIPAALISYGFTSLNSESLKDINLNIRQEVGIEHPHKAIHIDNFLQYAPALAVYGLNAAGIKGKHNFRDRTILYSMSMLISNATVFSLKNSCGVIRPDASNTLSFPSGHTANAFVAAEFMRQEYKDVSPWYGVAGYAVAATTGYLRMYNNKHWFSDVVTGAGIGIASTRVAYWLYPMIQRGLFKHKRPSTVFMPTYQDGAVGLGLVQKF